VRDEVRLKTVGIHPFTDAIYLHSVLEGLRQADLLGDAVVRSLSNHHVVSVSGEGDVESRVVAAMTDWVAEVLVQSLAIDPVVQDEVLRYLSSGYGRQALEGLVRSWVLERPPLSVEELVKVRTVSRRRRAAGGNLFVELRKRGADLAELKRSLLIIPHIGKYKFVPDTLRKLSRSEGVEPIPAIILFAGLSLSAVRLQRAGGSNKYSLHLSYGIPSNPLRPGVSVQAVDVWRLQAELRYRQGQHPLLSLVEGYYLGRGFAEDAAGSIVTAGYLPVKGSFGSEHVRVVRYSPQVFIGSKALIPKGGNGVKQGLKKLSGLRDFLNKVTVVELRVTSLGSLPQVLRAYELVGGSFRDLLGLVREVLGGGQGGDPSLANDLMRALTTLDRGSLYRLLRPLHASQVGKGSMPWFLRSAEFILNAFDLLARG